jgi:hypothetical protein
MTCETNQKKMTEVSAGRYQGNEEEMVIKFKWER